MRTPAIDFAAIPSPIILRGNTQRAYRDPCGHYHGGVFRVWHSNIRGRADSAWCAATAVTESRDLITWSEPHDVTERDRALNYSSPGNVIRHGGRWLMCLQTYPSSERQDRAITPRACSPCTAAIWSTGRNRSCCR